jgi:hypothetical protein
LTDDVSVEQAHFGKRSKKKRNKPGRPEKYPGDPKRKMSVTIRKSCIDKKPDDMENSLFLEKCVMSSAAPENAPNGFFSFDKVKKGEKEK